MKKTLIFVLAVVCSITFMAGCGNKPSQPQENVNPDQSQENVQDSTATQNPSSDNNTSSIPQDKAVISSYHSRDNVEKKVVDNGGTTTPEFLLQSLSDEQGLVYKANSCVLEGNKVTIDFNNETTFMKSSEPIAGKNGLTFPDYPTMAWFMLDSVKTTMTENLGVQEVHYTVNDGKQLASGFGGTIPGISPATMGIATPYMGSEALKQIMLPVLD